MHLRGVDTNTRSAFRPRCTKQMLVFVETGPVVQVVSFTAHNATSDIFLVCRALTAIRPAAGGPIHHVWHEKSTDLQVGGRQVGYLLRYGNQMWPPSERWNWWNNNTPVACIHFGAHCAQQEVRVK
ncbi:unnamed protein product [Lota lota]